MSGRATGSPGRMSSPTCPGSASSARCLGSNETEGGSDGWTEFGTSPLLPGHCQARLAGAAPCRAPGGGNVLAQGAAAGEVRSDATLLVTAPVVQPPVSA